MFYEHEGLPMNSPMVPPKRILLATTNRKKVLEMQRRLSAIGVELVSLEELGNAIEVDENGSTFMENAEIKAVQQAKHHQIWAIGEDSGLCVPALDGAPGIHSARYSGPDATDLTNNNLLLEKMNLLGEGKRDAYYVSTIALSDPQGKIWARSQGECHGRILRQARGEGGFGYDPLFEVVEYHLTFAELGLGVKGILSHRARALNGFIEQLQGIITRSVSEG